MKKILLLTILVPILSGLIFSQTPNRLTAKKRISNNLNHEWNYIDKENPSQLVAAKQMKSHLKKVTSLDNIKKYYIGSSGNVYTVLVSTSTCLTANEKTNTIMFTYRANPQKLINTIIGNILSSYSTDGGINWKTINITGSDTKENRYPSGVIYNPQDNTDPLQSYSVICGPTTDNTNWILNYFGRGRLDSTNFNVQYVSVNTYKEFFPRMGLTACDDGKIHVMGYSYLNQAIDSTIFRKGIVNNATFDAVNNKFIWTLADVNESFYSDQRGQYFNSFNTAWSQDGQIGYVYFIGIDSVDNYQSYMPIVFKSVDGGNTWDKLPDYDFGQLTDITSKIWPADSSKPSVPHIKYPYFTGEGDGVVDANGNLHIIGLIQGRYNSSIDSINYIYSFEPRKLFDVFTTSTGWSAQLIDTIHSGIVTSAESGFGTGTSATGWDHRIQASRTVDGKKIFAVWTDTDTSYYGVSDNFYPDIKAYGVDVMTGLRTNNKNFTSNTPYTGDNLWNYVGDITITDGTKYRIPITTSTTTTDPEDSVAHFYVTGVYFNESDFVTNPGIREVSENDFTVSQNYPNPYKNQTSVKVNLTKPLSLGLEVRNLLGQKVYEIPQHKVSAGEHIFIIESNNLQPGIYFYTVKAGQKSVSRKMIVK